MSNTYEMIEFIEHISKQRLPTEMDPQENEDADFEGAWQWVVEKARYLIDNS